jgi:Skp family chaperone for outer membrane proteins
VQTIRFSAALSTALALLVVLNSSTARGQVAPTQPGVGPGLAPPRANAPQSGGLGVNGIGVVDIAYIFKTYGKVKQQMDLMKQKVEAAEAEAKRDGEEIRRLAEQTKAFGQGTPDFKRGEEAYLRKQGELQLKISMQKKQFLDEEGKIFFSISKEIDDAVKVVATRSSINLVLRFNGDTPDPNDRNQILQGLNKTIVYYHPQMDITPYVLQELQRGGMVNPNPSANMAPIPRRQ